MKKTTLLLACAAALLLARPAPAQRRPKAQPELFATPATVAWGYYDAAAPPVLRIKSGETVRVHTLITSSPTRLEGAGVAPAQVEPALREIYEKVTNKGPGGHILTGPIFVAGAEVGDVLEVRVRTVELAIPYAYNGFGPKSGFIPEDFGYAKMKIIPLDKQRLVADFAPGITLPLHPFFGSMGVAPPTTMGRVNSAPPGIFGGNLDNKDLVAGTTLFLPVHAPGALFFVGDGHAGQGNGEVDITALETSLVGNLEFIVRKDLHLTVPRAETPTHYISMGLNEDLTLAAQQAVREMIDFLMKTKGMTKDDAYMLCSVAGDLNVTQVVDGTRGAHMLLPKAIFKK